jgi:hypothetical protein
MSGFAIPAEAGIQAGDGSRITPGVTALAYMVAGLMKKGWPPIWRISHILPTSHDAIEIKPILK